MIFHPGITHLRTSPSSIFSDQVLKDDWNLWELEKQNQIKYIAKLRTRVQWTCAKFVVSEPLSLNEMISALATLLSFYSFLLRTTLKTLTSALFAGLHSMNFKLCVSNMIKRSVSAPSSWKNNNLFYLWWNLSCGCNVRFSSTLSPFLNRSLLLPDIWCRAHECSHCLIAI